MRPLRAISIRFDRLRELKRRRELFCFARVFGMALLVPLLTRIELPRLAALLEPRTMLNRPDPQEVERVIRCVDYALVLGHPLIKKSCLTRAITLYYFLRRTSLEVEICFGAGFVEGQDAAHCWLIAGDEPYLEDVDPRQFFVEMYRIRPVLITS